MCFKIVSFVVCIVQFQIYMQFDGSHNGEYFFHLNMYVKIWVCYKHLVITDHLDFFYDLIMIVEDSFLYETLS